MYLSKIQKKISLNQYPLSKIIHNFTWEKNCRTFKEKKNFLTTSMIKPRSTQLDPTSHKTIKHGSTQPSKIKPQTYTNNKHFKT